MPRNLLTDPKVKNAKPKEKPYKLPDGGGLHLEVRPTGVKLWRYRYKVEGKENLFAIGEYPLVSLSEAREKRDEARKLVKEGKHPAHQRKAEKLRNVAAAQAEKLRAKSSFSQLFTEWLELGKSEWAAKTYTAKKTRIERHVIPQIGGTPIADVPLSSIKRVLTKCESAGKWSAIHIKGDLAAIFALAIKRGHIESNPIHTLRGLYKHPTTAKNKAVLTPAQLKTFFHELNAYRGFPETALAMSLIALTACRPGEMANAEWSEFDLEAGLWRRSAEKMKARREHVAPLSSEAIAVLRKLKAIVGDARYLVPHRDEKDKPIDRSRFTHVMREMDLGAGASPHCFRTTFSTWANERGFRPDAIELQLAHQERGKVRATYNKALLIEERRQMMEEWGRYLASMQAQNVIHLRAVS